MTIPLEHTHTHIGSQKCTVNRARAGAPHDELIFGAKVLRGRKTRQDERQVQSAARKYLTDTQAVGAVSREGGATVVLSK